MSENPATVYIVDDEASLRRTMQPVLESAGYRVETFESGEAFLDQFDPDRPGCVVLDIQMPGMTGLEVHARINEHGWPVPVVFLTAHGTIEVATYSLKSGAVNFLEKPIYPPDLIKHVAEACEIDARQRESAEARRVVNERLAALTQREAEILDHVVDGQSSRQIADALLISVKTVQLHRARIMKKLKAENVADLVRMVVDH